MRNIFDVLIFTLAYRVIGFLRDVVVASYLGNSVTADAYAVAYSVPNLVVEILALGAVGSAAMATFQTARENGAEALNRIYNRLMTSFACVLLVALVVCEFASGLLVHIMVPSFSGERFELTQYMIIRLLPAILCVGLLGPQRAILQMFGAFRTVGMANVVFNTTLVVGGLLAMWFDCFPLILYSFLVAAFLQCLVDYIGVRSFGVRLTPDFHFKDPALTNIWILMLPIMLNGLSATLGPVTARAVASAYETGAVSALNYAYKLINLPIGILTGAISSAAFPRIAEYAAKKRDDLTLITTSIFDVVLLLCVPIAGMMAVLNKPIVNIVFERGAFTSADTIHTGKMLCGYALCVVFTSIIQILNQEFYAFKKAREPMLIGICTAVLSIVFASILANMFGSFMIPWGYTIGQFLQVCILYVRINRIQKGIAAFSARKGVILTAILVVFGVWSLGVGHLYENHIATLSIILRFGYLGITCGGAFVAYLLVLWKTNTLHVRESLKILRS